jgi:hypothetical protein
LVGAFGSTGAVCQISLNESSGVASVTGASVAFGGVAPLGAVLGAVGALGAALAGILPGVAGAGAAGCFGALKISRIPMMNLLKDYITVEMNR